MPSSVSTMLRASSSPLPWLLTRPPRPWLTPSSTWPSRPAATPTPAKPWWMPSRPKGWCPRHRAALATCWHAPVPALEQPVPVYAEAEVMHFCSARIAWQLARENPINVAQCPLSMAIYTLPNETGVVHLAWRRQRETLPAPGPPTPCCSALPARPPTTPGAAASAADAGHIPPNAPLNPSPCAGRHGIVRSAPEPHLSLFPA
jgi:hypothetical protein